MLPKRTQDDGLEMFYVIGLEGLRHRVTEAKKSEPNDSVFLSLYPSVVNSNQSNNRVMIRS